MVYITAPLTEADLIHIQLPIYFFGKELSDQLVIVGSQL
jgi:hypothetical protein